MAFFLPTTLAIIALVFSFAHAFDRSPLQDFCVAANDPKTTVFVNGRVCKDPKKVTEDASPPPNRLDVKTLNAGDVFVIPPSLLHYRANVGKVKATSFNSLNSQNPGIAPISSLLFGSVPTISVDILSKAFRVEKETIELIRSEFA
ncbi:PREDICTED: germin-like protein subfamily 1 member 20 [Ipomoea nil]|uniref:germin-like protein subfamily 1 member 20 n=1 Tax=Ipomoea nil TaxID=35883 RepID=UPI000900A02D|nr:PREDICTED: germin-like protein subfamily 1 member 20 [Ipomoea nil]